MNDFTKEELQDIYEAVMDTNIAMFEYLPSKIQSMLENYDAKVIPVWHCEKCGHVQ